MTMLVHLKLQKKATYLASEKATNLASEKATTLIVSYEDNNSAHDEDDALSIQGYDNDNEIYGLLDEGKYDENSVRN